MGGCAQRLKLTERTCFFGATRRVLIPVSQRLPLWSYEELENLSDEISSFCPASADGEQLRRHLLHITPSNRKTNDHGFFAVQWSGVDTLNDKVRNVSPRNNPVAPFGWL